MSGAPAGDGTISDPLIIQQLENQHTAAAPPNASGTVTDPLVIKQLEQQSQPWSGSVLPVSGVGNDWHLDWNAGIPGAIKSALTLPGDVYTGQTPIMSPQGGPNPDLINRSIGTAAMMSPAGAAGRATGLTGVPSAAQLKSAAGAGYDAARASGLEINGEAVASMAQGLQQNLQDQGGIIAKTAPKTFGILDELAKPPANSVATIPGILAARRGLSNLRLDPDGTERLAAGRAVAGLDNFMSSLNNSQIASGASGATSAAGVAQTLSDAAGNYAAAQRSNDLTGALDRANTGIMDRAEARAEASHSGTNIDNAIRSRVASFLQNPSNLAGFSQPEIDSLQGLVAGGAAQNTARYVGNLFGGGGGLGHLLGMASGFGIGHALGGDAEAGAIGAMIPGSLGITAKAAENALARRALAKVDETIRMRSPLYQSMLQQGQIYSPLSQGPAASGLMRGLLMPTPDQSGQ